MFTIAQIYFWFFLKKFNFRERLQDIQFKLIQNPSKIQCDHLLTVIPDGHNHSLQNKAYSVAAEYLSALCWQLNSRVKLKHIGGSGVSDDFNLRSARPSIFTYREVAFCGHIIECDIFKIPKISTNEQRDALALFRDASSVNHDYLAFHFYWQILNIGSNPIGWVNKTYRRHRSRLWDTSSWIDQLPQQVVKSKLGNYFYEDCRNAIAHLTKRKACKTILGIDNLDDNGRIAISLNIIRGFAEYFITNELELNSNVYLVRENNIFPKYVNEDFMGNNNCRLVSKVS